MPYIYLIREREFIRLNEYTYKVGKTGQTPNKRMGGYPKGSEVLLYTYVDNHDTIETIILDKFKITYTQKREYGTEYFYGDKNQMIKTIMDIIFENNIPSENTLTESKTKTPLIVDSNIINYCKRVLKPYKNFSKDAQILIQTHYSSNLFNMGIDGISILMNKILPEGVRYILSFSNEPTLFYRNINDEIEPDNKAEKFLDDIFQSIFRRVTEIYREQYIQSQLKI